MDINQVGPFLRAMRDPEGKGTEQIKANGDITPEEIQRMEDRIAEIRKFNSRIFSGRDLLTIMDHAGIGVGATMHSVHMIDNQIERRPDIYRQWDFPPNQGDDMTINPAPAVGQIWVSLDERNLTRQIELVEATEKDGMPAFKTRPLDPAGSASTIKAENLPVTYRYDRQAALGQES
jgi:hypothetical protein